MRRIRRGIFALVTLACAIAAPASAFEIPERVPVELGGRFGVSVTGDRDAVEFPWNNASRSVTAGSRLMLDLRAGTDRWGCLYVKGVSSWSDHDAGDGAVGFEFDQADYVVSRDADAWAVTARLFANERRYFTGALGVAALDDDAVDRHDDHGGGRLDGRVGRDFSWTGIGALMDDGGERRTTGYGDLRYHGGYAHAAISYLGTATDIDTLGHGTVVKAEAAVMWRRATAIVSYAQSGIGDDATLIPDGSFDWGAYGGDNFAEAMPAAGAAGAELRVDAIPAGGSLDASLAYRYRAVGAEYRNALAPVAPGMVSNAVLLNVSHREYAADGRLEYRRRARYATDWLTTEHVVATGRAFLKNGTEAVLRGGFGEYDDDRIGARDDHFIHGFLRNSGGKVRAGVHAMVLDRDRPDIDARFGVEARVNWTANLSVYGRVIAAQSGGSSDAIVWRVEFRPLDHVFATLGYGRSVLGDGPYLLEDRDLGDTGDADDVYTVTIRGDF